ncbi:MAG: hypothetical protein ACHQFW_12340, partial [Chitinophagales bacterium]
MHQVTQHIVRLLHDHNCVIVPGFGGFVTNYQPAKVHPTSFIFNSPSKSVAFNIKLTSNDGLLSHAIASAESISQSEAEAMIREFVSQVKTAVYDHKPVKLAGIGRLTVDVENNIQFLPDNSQNFLLQSYGLPTYTAQPVVREQTYEVKPLRAITVANPKKKRNFVDALLPIAAILLLAMLTIQIFIAQSMNGFNYAEIFGMKDMFSKNNYILEKYEPVKFDINQGIIYFRKTDPAPIIPEDVKSNQLVTPIDQEVIAPVAKTKYILVAGALNSVDRANIILNNLSEKGYEGFVKPWGKYQLAAVSIPDN